MQSAGSLEHQLRWTQFRIERIQGLRPHREISPDWRCVGADGFESSFAANAAGGRSEKVPFESLWVERHALVEMNRDDVEFLRIGFAIRDFPDIGMTFDDRFCEQKPGSQLEIVAGGAHRDRDAFLANSNLQWFLDRDHVLTGL